MYLIENRKQTGKKGFFDLNSILTLMYYPSCNREVIYEHWQNDFFTGHVIHTKI